MADKHGSDIGSDPTRISSGVTGTRVVSQSALGEQPPRIPQVIIESELGRGGMGMVWQGRQEYIDRAVAVKVLTAEHGLDDAFRRRFQREAKILADFNHPHLVSCYAAGVNDDGLCFLVMELIKGSDLNSYLKEHGPLSAPAVIELGIAMSQALEHIWAKGVIHRDVKCENILCSHEAVPAGSALPFVPKLADVGLAKPSANSPSSDGFNLTMSGMIVGTPSTMAPEQFDRPESIDHRADIYALGCVLFQALCGRRAFPQRGLSQLMAAKTSQPDLRQWSQHSAWPQLRQVVEDCLKPDPDQRPADYASIRQRLQACQPLSAAPGKRPRLLLVAGMLAAVAVLLAVIVLQWLSAPGSAGDSPTQVPMPPEDDESVADVADVPAPGQVVVESEPWPHGSLWRQDFLRRLVDWQQEQGGWGAAEETSHPQYSTAIDGFAPANAHITLSRSFAVAERGSLGIVLSPLADLSGHYFEELRFDLGHAGQRISLRIQHLGSLGLLTLHDAEGGTHGPLTLAGDGSAQPWSFVCSWHGQTMSVWVGQGDHDLLQSADPDVGDSLSIAGAGGVSQLQIHLESGGVRIHDLRYDPAVVGAPDP